MTTVLVVEDDELARTTIRQMLQKAGYEVITAANGNQALAAFAIRPADLVVVDMIMPEKDGVETIIDLRRRHPGVRVLAMSGGGRTRNLDFLNYAGQVGARGILPKPFTRDELLTAVNAALAD